MSIANDSGRSRSVWMAQDVPTYDDPLPHELTVDVLVVGAGIAGLSVALAMIERGADVLVVDHGAIGGGQTARTTAHLASALDDRIYRLERRFGREGAKLAVESHAAAIDTIELRAIDLGIDCDFARCDGYLWGRASEIEKEMMAAERAGLDVELVVAAPLPFPTGPCLRFANQARFHPIRYVRGLARAVAERNGRIRTNVHVANVEPGTPVTVTLGDGRKLYADALVDATNMGITSRFELPIREAAYRSYVCAFAAPRDHIPDALYWDTDEPYHYIRTLREASRDLVLVGGADHRTGQGDPSLAFHSLEHWARQRMPELGELVQRWSGQVMEPADGLAHIGALPHHDNVYVVSGDSGNGLTHGTIASLLLPALISGRGHRWAKIYDPARSYLRAAAGILGEGLRSNVPYADWIRAGDAGSIDDIPRGSGATIRRGLHLVAVYRDDHGTCHELSARCPHLSGAVRWNDAEGTWDCPCHGSRFSARGHVLNGPATSDLQPVPSAGEPAPEAVPVAPLIARPGRS